MIKVGPYQYEDEDKLISQFKETLKPKYYGDKSKFNDFTVQDEKEYKTLLIWLGENSYIIEEFPNVILQKLSLKAFAYDQIRSKILKDNPSNKVTWQDRRELIDSLHLRKTEDFPIFSLEDNFEEKINDIANRRGPLQTQTHEDQLATLNNCIEYLLKKNGKYAELHSSIFYNYIDEQKVKQYRKDTQIFRHSSENSLKERKAWSEKKKSFYIRLGILIVNNIYYSINSN